MAEENLNANLYAQMEQAKEIDNAKTPYERHIAAEKLARGDLPENPPYQPLPEKPKSSWWKFWNKPSKTSQSQPPQMPKAA